MRFRKVKEVGLEERVRGGEGVDEGDKEGGEGEIRIERGRSKREGGKRKEINHEEDGIIGGKEKGKIS